DHPEHGRSRVLAPGDRAKLYRALLPRLDPAKAVAGSESATDRDAGTLENLALDQGAETGGEIFDESSDVHGARNILTDPRTDNGRTLTARASPAYTMRRTSVAGRSGAGGDVL